MLLYRTGSVHQPLNCLALCTGPLEINYEMNNKPSLSGTQKSTDFCIKHPECDWQVQKGFYTFVLSFCTDSGLFHRVCEAILPILAQ